MYCAIMLSVVLAESKCCFPMAHIQYFRLGGGLSSSPEGIVVFFSKYFPKGTMVEMIIPLCECK